jgi:hypothetical protein
MALSREEQEAEAEVRALERKYRHKCPPWCHRCPLMGGEVMPECWGTVIFGATYGLRACDCVKPQKPTAADVVSDLVRRVEKLEQR